MIARCLPLLLILLLRGELHGEVGSPLKPGSTHHLTFRDVDGDVLSTSDGHVTILTAVTRADEDKARAVADLIPDRYIGDRNYQYVTLVNFESKVPGPFQGLTRTIIRNRLAAEARELKSQYIAKKIPRDPRDDIHVIADFDGSAARQLGLSAETAPMGVFVFNGAGKLIAHWNEVPPGESLPEAIAAAG